jgi:hypothetical protein
MTDLALAKQKFQLSKCTHYSECIQDAGPYCQSYAAGDQQRSVPQCVLIVLRYIKAHAEKSIVTKEFRAACPRVDRSCSSVNLC